MPTEVFHSSFVKLSETIKHLEQIGVPLVKKKEISEYGKFIWIKDPENRLIELWEK